MYGVRRPDGRHAVDRPAGSLHGELRYTDGAESLMISPVAGARVLTPSPTAAWGLHLLDGNVALGDLVDIVCTQGKRYLKKLDPAQWLFAVPRGGQGALTHARPVAVARWSSASP